jgi:AcrR family transcriptional regulator
MAEQAPPDQQTAALDAAPATGEGRALRADARRNRQSVLAAAEAVFAVQGVAAPIDEVASMAGVGIGTVYRHFPTKEALYEAVVVDRMQRLLDEIVELARADDAGRALFAALTRIVEVATSKRDLADALARAGVDVRVAAAAPFEQLQIYVGDLLARAQAEGAVRGDVETADLIALISGTCMAAEHHGCVDGARKLTAILCDGLRPLGPV